MVHVRKSDLITETVRTRAYIIKQIITKQKKAGV